ncbi:ATP-binding cassette domain-containing protein [uncultured Eubacterium sp.]|uniref:ATP-binding cassette domain-containing protein n=1 Tax=uncultured Eubacterium sp. TaxID=165185 RepID=UPI0025965361|nr:ATP-binding cassette domain-containing protein [uncultured Eubacterium sp.]
MDKGEIFGFLGPNGAGKTTTVKLLCGMLTPSGGKCQVLGIDPVQNPEQLHQKVGVVTEHAQNVNSLIQEQAAIPLIVKRIVEAGGDLYHVSEQQMSLEEICFSLIDRELYL